MLREVLIGEAMHALGIPTTRALAVVATGEPVRARDGAAGRGADARRGQPHPRRHVPVLRRARRRRAGAPARRVHDRPPRPRSRRHARPLPRAARARRRAPGRADRAVDERRLHPRRDEHRQHDDLGRDHRLRPVRLHRGLRPGGGVQLDRQPAAATPSATSPRIAHWNLARLAETLLPLHRRRRRRAGRGAGHARCIEAFPALLSRATCCAASAPSSACATRRRRRAADAALADDWLALLHAQPRRLHARLAAPRRRRRRRRGAAARAVRRCRGAATPGWRAGASAARARTKARGRATSPRAERAPRACAASTRGSSRATIASRKRSRPRRTTTTSARSSACSPRCAARTTRSPSTRRYAEPAPAEVTACYQTFCGT